MSNLFLFAFLFLSELSGAAASHKDSTSLTWACIKRRTAKVHELIGQVSPLEHDRYGFGSLHAITLYPDSNQHAFFYEQLIGDRADEERKQIANFPTIHGIAPLTLGISHSSPEFVQKLLTDGADPKILRYETKTYSTTKGLGEHTEIIESLAKMPKTTSPLSFIKANLAAAQEQKDATAVARAQKMASILIKYSTSKVIKPE